MKVSQPGSVGDFIERPGDFIGPYRLMEQVGEGGFGTVWRAEQTKPVHREVALKVIKPGMDSREIIARFEAERQALALMDHPSIARMFDGGTTPAGRPYFAMEFVKGEPVNVFCDSRRLPIADRIPIFLDICSAVQHAHQKGILHRDLKPSNILVTEIAGRVVPKVIDFGVAKALGQQLTDKTMFTAIGLAIGTPEYMSPEQAGAGNQDVDTRSDVYSLGVILYELLTGSTPLRREEARKLAVHQLMEVLRTQDAERPSTRFQHFAEATRKQVAAARQIEFTRLQKFLRGDLDWIVMRALEKDRNRRYQTVNALALDLQRYLKGDPVEAGPPSASYRLGKLARRYRGPLVAAALLLLSIVAGLAFTVWQAARAKKAEQRAALARDAAENLISEGVHGLRRKLMAVGKVEAMEEIAAAAEEYYRRLPPELYDDVAKRHLVSLSINRALIAEALGRDRESEVHTRNALRIGEEIASRHPDDEKLHDEICYAMLGLCFVFMDRNDNASLIPMADAVLARCEAWLRRKPGSLWAMRYQVNAHNFAAQASVRYLRKIPEGMARFQTAAAITRRMREVGGETAEVCECEGLIHYGNANIAGRTGQQDAEIREFEASLASFGRALELGGDSALLREVHMGAMHHAGWLAFKRASAKGDAAAMKRGEETVRQAFEGRRRLVELEPGRAEWWRDLAYSHRVFGDFAAHRKDWASQIESLKEDLRCRDEAVRRQPNRPQLLGERGTTCSILASTFLKIEPPDPRQAGEFTLRALDDWARSVEMAGYQVMGQSVKNDVERLSKLAASNPSAGVPLLVSARRMLEPLLGKTDGKNDLAAAYGMLTGSLRDNLAKLGRAAEAAEVGAALDAHLGGARTAAELHEAGKAALALAKTDWDRHFSLPDSEQPAAMEKIEAQRAKAHPQLEQAVEKEPENPDHRDTLAGSWRLKGRIEKKLGHSAEAAAAFGKAFALLDPEKHADAIADAHVEFGEALRNAKEYAAAVPHYRAAIRQRDARCAQTAPPPTGFDFSRAGQPWSALANCQFNLGDNAGSLASLRETLKHRQRAHDMEPDNRAWHWDLAVTQMEIVLRLANCGELIPPIESAVPCLKDLKAFFQGEADLPRLRRYSDSPLNGVHDLLRKQKRLSEAAAVLRHIITLRQRIEELDGGVKVFDKSSISARISLAVVLEEQHLAPEASAELGAALADAAKTAQPVILVDTHLAARGGFDTLRKHEAAEHHARIAYDIAQENDTGWRAIRAANSLGSTLTKRGRHAEAEKILLEAWEKAAALGEPGEHADLRAHTAAVLCDVHHGMHMGKPDAERAAAARVWVRRAAEARPLDPKMSESEFNSAVLNWMGWLAQLADEGNTGEYRRQRTTLLLAAKNFSYQTTRERVAKAALLLPAEGAELKQATEGAAAAFQSNPSDEWLRFGHCLALLRTGRVQESLDTVQPLLKSADTARSCYAVVLTALAHRKLGRHDEADAQIAAIEKDGYRSKHLSSPTQRDAIVARVLFKEAKQR